MSPEKAETNKKNEPTGIAALGVVFVLAGMSGVVVNTPELPGPWTLRALLTFVSGCMILGGIALLALPTTMKRDEGG